MSQNFHRFVILRIICWDTPSENIGLWQLPIVSCAFKRFSLLHDHLATDWCMHWLVHGSITFQWSYLNHPTHHNWTRSPENLNHVKASLRSNLETTIHFQAIQRPCTPRNLYHELVRTARQLFNGTLIMSSSMLKSSHRICFSKCTT